MVFCLPFRIFDSVWLNEKTTQFLTQRSWVTTDETAGRAGGLFTLEMSPPRKMVRLPVWLGWAMLSVGGVLILHSFALRKPDR